MSAGSAPPSTSHARPGLRVLVSTTSYPASDTDSAGIFVLGFAETLQGLGHHVHVVAPALPGTGPSPRREPERGPRGIPLTRLVYARPASLQRTFHRAGAPENLRRDPLAWLGAISYPLALGRYLGTHASRHDVLVSHWAVPSGLVAALLPRSVRARRVVVTHGADIHLLERLPGGAALARRIARASDAITFVSAGHQRRFEALVGWPLPHGSVLAMGVDAEPCDVPREQARRALGVEGRVLLTLGRLVPIKGLDVLVRALEGVPDVTLVVAGEGPEREALARLAARLEVRTRFVGVVLGHEKASWLRAADALVLPSRRLASGREEGTPTALLEAMLAGLPVIASDTGGVAEALRGGELGALVRPDDVPALRAALLDTLTRVDLSRLRAALARDAAEAQRWPSLASRLERLVRGA